MLSIIFSFKLSFANPCSRLARVWKLSYHHTPYRDYKYYVCSRLTRTRELRKLSYKLSLVNCHQLSCNSCSRLNRTRELRKLSYKLSLVNCHQLSCNSCSRLTRTRELRKLSYKLSLVNCHQLSCNSCSRLNRTWELRKLSYKLSLINSRQLLFQVFDARNSVLDATTSDTSSSRVNGTTNAHSKSRDDSVVVWCSDYC